MIVKAIPTNIITGFLGVGKTSLIKQLLATKPENETWAVLVNEFGEVGIDAGLLNNSDAGIQIREVSGGCMCCAAGVPTQVAINQLIARAKPDRLLIEPTGLGHPNEIIKVLSAPHYQNVISLRSTLCLVDARKVSDPRYNTHANFIQQLQVADVIVATKADLYSDAEIAGSDCTESDALLTALHAYINDLQRIDIPIVSHSSQRDLPLELRVFLDQPRRERTWALKANAVAKPHSLLRGTVTSLAEMGLFAESDSEQLLSFDPRGIARKQNQGEGCFSCGWVFEPSQEFDFYRLMAFVERQTKLASAGASLLRLKAVMITTDGIVGINWVDRERHITEIDDTLDSRLEMIATQELDWDDIEQQLMACLVV
ncbi:GTP-binding protein [Shewanella sp. KJ2020]|uniref:CobW family GTP-binding protein n=1 Tax=Shewanella sp. KJ2020 TaxID=2919172 RepID=UPI0020A7031B|nr:GTP-binding protein [Shewanella sp. KJ2020]MCP3127875.1 GTP-binding protein [Shewanella sp. KJ2020]